MNNKKLEDDYKEELKELIDDCQKVIDSPAFNYWVKLDEMQRQNEYINELLDIKETPEEKMLDNLVF